MFIDLVDVKSRGDVKFKVSVSGISQEVCAPRLLSIMGRIQNLIICLRWRWVNTSTAEWIFVNYAVEIYDFALILLRKLLKTNSVEFSGKKNSLIPLVSVSLASHLQKRFFLAFPIMNFNSSRSHVWKLGLKDFPR